MRRILNEERLVDEADGLAAVFVDDAWDHDDASFDGVDFEAAACDDRTEQAIDGRRPQRATAGCDAAGSIRISVPMRFLRAST
jgi:hypothetical protein